MTQQQLLQGLRDHDPAVVELVYSQVRPGIISYVKQNNGSHDEALDVIQDAMLAAYVSITKPDFELSAALSTFIQSIARRAWLKNIERYKKRYIPDNTI